MVRGVILGSLAFAAVLAAERQFESMSHDIDRYNRIRAMSDDPSLFKELINAGLDMLSSFTDSRRGEALGFLQSIQRDVMRYARIASM